MENTKSFISETLYDIDEEIESIIDRVKCLDIDVEIAIKKVNELVETKRYYVEKLKKLDI